MAKSNNSLCIGVATFQIDGKTKQFGLTQEDFDMFIQRAEKLQESINSMTSSLERFREKKVKLENQLAVIRSPKSKVDLVEVYEKHRGPK